MTGQSTGYRGAPGAPPPLPLPLVRGGRPLKRWTYVGVYGPEVMVCGAEVQVGPLRQAFWAVWDRTGGHLQERTRFLVRGRVSATARRLHVADGDMRIDLALEPAGQPVESLCPSGAQRAWTRKTPLRATGTVDGRLVEAEGILDESAGHHMRHTAWRWSAGVGRVGRRAVAWNLVAGINDPATGSERAVWVDGVPAEVAPVTFAADLSSVFSWDGLDLDFAAEVNRRRHDELLVLASDYTQPFGTFSGTLPGGRVLDAGWGVMERHVARW